MVMKMTSLIPRPLDGLGMRLENGNKVVWSAETSKGCETVQCVPGWLREVS